MQYEPLLCGVIKMELRQHIGILAILIMIAYLIWAWNKDWENGYKPYIPLGGGVLLWCIFEVFYWIFALLIV